MLVGSEERLNYLVEKADKGEQLTLREMHELAEAYQANTEYGVEIKRVAAKVEQAAAEIRGKGEAGGLLAEELVKTANILRVTSRAYLEFGGQFHQVLLNLPEGNEILSGYDIKPDQKLINRMFQEAVEQAEQEIERQLEAREKARVRTERGEGRHDRGKGNDRHEDGREKPHDGNGRRLKGKGTASVEDNVKDAAIVLAELDHGEGNRGSGVENMKIAGNGPAVG